MSISDSQIRATKLILGIFISSIIISYLYTLIGGVYNGDFLGMKVEMSYYLVFVNLLLTIAPFLVLWFYYKKLKKKTVNRIIQIPLTPLVIFLIFILIWNIIVTLLFGVGVMAAEAYDAPNGIKQIIQVMNRFNYVYGFFIYFLICPKNDRLQILLIVLLLVVSYLRAGLGIFLYLIVFSIVKYYEDIVNYIHKNKFTFIFLVLFIPTIVGLLFEIRSNLRNQDKEDLTTTSLIFGRLAGRMSSFSDSAMILQEFGYFFSNAYYIEDFYFQKQALGSIVGMQYMPNTRLEQLLFRFYGVDDDSEDTVSYMPGIQGALIFSLYKSVFNFILILASYLAMIFLTFYFSRMLNFNYNNEYAFILLLYVLTSGVSNEFSLLFFSIFVYCGLFIVINYFKHMINLKRIRI